MKRYLLIACIFLSLALGISAWIVLTQGQRSGPRESAGLAKTEQLDSAHNNDQNSASQSSPSKGAPAGESSSTAGGNSSQRAAIDAPQEKEPEPLLTGSILESDGSPAVGAQVFARTGGWYSIVPIELSGSEGDTQTLSADARGQFAFMEGLELGSSLSVAIVHKQHATVRMIRMPFLSAPHDLGSIKLRPGLSFSGFVQTESGEPIANAKVLLAAARGVEGLEGSFPGEGTVLTQTDDAGAFLVDTLSPGEWHLLFDAEGRQVAERRGHERKAKAIELDPIVLTVGHTIRGMVTDLPMDLEPADFMVEARCEQLEPANLRRPRRTQLNPDGSFEIKGVTPHSEVRVRLLSKNTAGLWVPSSEVPQVTVPSDTTNVRLQWGQKLSLQARVVDQAGLPIVGYAAFSQLGYFGGTHPIGGEGPGETLSHHPNGELHASGLRLYSEERTTALIIRAPGYQDHTREVEGLLPGQTVSVGDITLTPTAILSVHVRDPKGRPVEGAELVLVPYGKETGNRTAQTNAQGQATLNAFQNIRSGLEVRHELWSDAREVLFPTQLSVSKIRIRLGNPCQLTVQITSPNGAALDGHSIYVAPMLPSQDYDVTTTNQTKQTNRDGRVEFPRLRPGYWRVSRQPHSLEWRGYDNRINEVKVVQLSRNEPTLVEFTVRPESSVEGVVHDYLGPLSTATLRLFPLDQRKRESFENKTWNSLYNRVTNAFGEFRFDRIPHGLYRLEIEHDSRAMVAQREILVPPNQEPLEIYLSDGSLRVRVIDESGSPVPNATVELDAGDSSYGGWNDGRRAWTDERGDLKQAWHQHCFHQRQSDAGGWALFEGCLPGIPLSLKLADRNSADVALAVDTLAPGEHRSLNEALVWYAAGEIKVHRKDVFMAHWRVSWTPLSSSGSGEPDKARTQTGAPNKTISRAIAGPGQLELYTVDRVGKSTRLALLELDLPAGQTLNVNADIREGTLELDE